MQDSFAAVFTSLKHFAPNSLGNAGSNFERSVFSHAVFFFEFNRFVTYWENLSIVNFTVTRKAVRSLQFLTSNTV